MKQKILIIMACCNLYRLWQNTRLIVLLMSAIFITPSLSQAIVINTVGNDGVTTAQITAALQGAGVTISNMTIVNNGCANRILAVGLFSQGTTSTGPGPVLGDASGIVLGTGPLKTPGDFLVSPNSDPRWDNTLCTGNVSDPDMVALVPQTANGEYTAIEFDIVPSLSIMSIPFQFGSDEFPEYVCSAFNDATGIFVSGPGIAGPYSLGAENFAKTANGDLSSINWVNTGVVGTNGNLANCGSLTNTAYYTDNSNGDLSGGNATVATTNANLELDGWTNYIYQPITVTPGSSYHVKAIVADAGDRNWDSAVFFHLITSSGTLPGFDFGDAPETYRTLTSSGGPRHRISNQIYLGTNLPDNEVTGQPTATADGDDLNGSDDEDGIASFPALISTATSYSVNVTVNNTTGSTANLIGWIDYNRNGSFETAEGATVTVPTGTVNGTATLNWSGLSGMTGGNSYARFRLTTDPVVTTATPGGTATNGEIEDYPLAIVGPDLSTSIKTVIDLNGGDVEFDDILRYSITLRETGGGPASGVQVTDNIPLNIDSFTVVSLPTGATDFSTFSGTGVNGTGFLDIRNIAIPANGSATVSFQVRVSGPNGNTIDNTASVINPNGPGATPSTPTLIIAGASLPASGTKQLYLQAPDNETSPTIPQAMSRTPLAVFPNPLRVRLRRNDTPVRWDLTPPLSAPLALNTGINVVLWMTASNTANRNFDITLSYNAGAGQVLLMAPQPFSFSISDTLPVLYTMSLSTPATTIPAGAVLQMTIDNDNTNQFYIYPLWDAAGPFIAPTDYSRIEYNAATVINVDSITFHDTAYPAASPITQAAGNDTVYIRAVVSDPFGDFDITDASLDLTSGNGSPILTGTVMAEVVETVDNPATKTFEYAYTLPALPASGFWTATVTSNEGTEGIISDYGLASFEVPAALPALTVLKSADRATVNPGEVITYTITTINSGAGPATTVKVFDNLSPFVGLILDYDGITPPYEPFDFVPGSSGLTLGTPDYYDAGGLFTPDFVAGEDDTVVRWETPMTGSFNAGSQFTLRFKVRVK